MSAAPTTPTAAQKAYALLWRSLAECPYAKRARQELLASMSEDEQREAIAWLVQEVGPVTDREMIAADMRAGVFPRRSYDPAEQPATPPHTIGD